MREKLGNLREKKRREVKQEKENGQEREIKEKSRENVREKMRKIMIKNVKRNYTKTQEKVCILRRDWEPKLKVRATEKMGEILKRNREKMRETFSEKCGEKF